VRPIRFSVSNGSRGKGSLASSLTKCSAKDEAFRMAEIDTFSRNLKGNEYARRANGGAAL